MIEKKERKATGSYYTCSSITEYITNWAIRTRNDSLLEPSFGDGGFLKAAIGQYRKLGNENPIIYGVELQEELYDKVRKNYPDVKCFLSDYMDFTPDNKVTAIIGNPPYVGLKKLSLSDREKAINKVKDHQITMPQSGSLWMPFIIHATEMLEENGRLGFVLPFEFTYVRYAFRLWEYLGDKFGQLSVFRIHEDFFPEVDVETIIFLADKKGKTTNSVQYKVFETVPQLYQNNPALEASIDISEIIGMTKPFEKKLISLQTQNIISKLKSEGKVHLLREECKFKIGYVCGNKSYFHPSLQEIESFGILYDNLIPCILNAKEISGNAAIGLDAPPKINTSQLFYPKSIDPSTQKYIDYGEKKGVNQAYKCRVRSPWYITPSVETPDVILTVFGDVPRLITNSGKYVVSNSLLSGLLEENHDPKNLICRWYNSLTLLLIEMTIHSLGGGTLVLIPGETDQLEILKDFPESCVEETYSKLETCVKEKGVSNAYELGNELVLKKVYSLTNEEINSIQSSLDYLRSWRSPEKRRE